MLYRLDIKNPCEIYITWKRGVDLKNSKKYKIEANNQDGFAVQQLVFDQTEVFSKSSGFYKEKEGHWQDKKAEIIIKKVINGVEEKLHEITVNLS